MSYVTNIYYTIYTLRVQTHNTYPADNLLLYSCPSSPNFFLQTVGFHVTVGVTVAFTLETNVFDKFNFLKASVATLFLVTIHLSFSNGVQTVMKFGYSFSVSSTSISPMSISVLLSSLGILSFRLDILVRHLKSQLLCFKSHESPHVKSMVLIYLNFTYPFFCFPLRYITGFRHPVVLRL